jgi:hypothetical protein
MGEIVSSAVKLEIMELKMFPILATHGRHQELFSISMS